MLEKITQPLSTSCKHPQSQREERAVTINRSLFLSCLSLIVCIAVVLSGPSVCQAAGFLHQLADTAKKIGGELANSAGKIGARHIERKKLAVSANSNSN